MSMLADKIKIQTKPCEIAPRELHEKLRHIGNILREHSYDSLLINSEGGMRWLTGLRHQVGDISPGAVSPVGAFVRIVAKDAWKISIISSPYEMPRLEEQISAVFDELKQLEYEFLTSEPSRDAKILSPEKSGYKQLTDCIIRPLLGGLTGNQYKKLDWLSNMTMKILAETAHELIPGMNGQAVRGLLVNNLAKHGIEANVVLVSLKGQEKHLHPLPNASCKVEEDSWMKLVVGARFAEHIVSESIMVKLGGGITECESLIYRALQESAIEYADCYRANASEKNIHREMCERFFRVGKKYGLEGFEESALLHHPGGGTSPLGNRDWMINSDGGRKFEPWTQFAINPVDCLAGLKVELQGIVQSDGAPPHILDMSKYISPDILCFRNVTSEYETRCLLPELLIV